MKYFNEKTVSEMIDLCFKFAVPKTILFANMPSIEIKEPHGRIIDEDTIGIKDEWSLVETSRIWNAPTILESTKGDKNDNTIHQ